MDCSVSRSTSTDVRWARVVAAILGGLLALWLLRGDTDAADEVLLTGKVHQERSYDFDGIEFFTIGRITLNADHDLPIAARLRAHEGERVTLTLKGAHGK